MGYIFDKKLIPEICSQLKSEYKRVVLTHGTFDLYHIGHSVFLNQSKKQGDILFVGVESDDRVKKLKDVKRPIISAVNRARILSQLNFVDFVFQIDTRGLLNEDYYIDLYKRVSPDMVTYGRKFDYQKQYTKKKNLIKGVSYKQLDTDIAPSSEFYESTTSIINRILNK